MRALLFLALLVGLCPPLRASSSPQPHPTRGIVVRVDEAAKRIDVSCDAIPNYMSAMEMSFAVEDARALGGLRAGLPVTFLSTMHGKTLYAEHIQPATTASFSREPLEAGNLSTLNTILDPARASRVVQPGEHVPDFHLLDQTNRPVHLAQFQGKVVVVTFGYSRCPYPDFCPRLADNLAQLQKKFHGDAGRNLVLLTIAIDPEHDQGKALTAYANTWQADPAVWHFLTGSLADVKAAASLFGMDFWANEGLLTHPLHTALIDRQGKLVVNWEGNHFTPQQLSDLVNTVLSTGK